MPQHLFSNRRESSDDRRQNAPRQRASEFERRKKPDGRRVSDQQLTRGFAGRFISS